MNNDQQRRSLERAYERRARGHSPMADAHRRILAAIAAQQRADEQPQEQEMN